MSTSLAPVILFVFNRPKETQQAIEALQNNGLAQKSELFIFSDAGRTASDDKSVKRVRETINNVGGFKRVLVHEAKENKGLAISVISGVEEIIEQYGKAIVVEDDLICSKDFLEYMNDALDIFCDNQDIWSISGYTPQLTFPTEYASDIYLAPRGCSWGWATWQDRWEKVDWQVTGFRDLKKNKKECARFNQGGNDLFKLLELQVGGKIDSWAIRWCYSQFKENMHTVYPRRSKIINNGFVKTGTHTGGPDSRWKVELCHEIVTFPDRIDINDDILKEFKMHYDLDLIGSIGFFLKKHGFYDLAYKFKWIFRK